MDLDISSTRIKFDNCFFLITKKEIIKIELDRALRNVVWVQCYSCSEQELQLYLPLEWFYDFTTPFVLSNNFTSP